MRLRCKTDPTKVVEGDFRLVGGWWVQDKPIVSYHSEYWEAVEGGSSEQGQ